MGEKGKKRSETAKDKNNNLKKKKKKKNGAEERWTGEGKGLLLGSLR